MPRAGSTSEQPWRGHAHSWEHSAQRPPGSLASWGHDLEVTLSEEALPCPACFLLVPRYAGLASCSCCCEFKDPRDDVVLVLFVHCWIPSTHSSTRCSGNIFDLMHQWMNGMPRADEQTLGEKLKPSKGKPPAYSCTAVGSRAHAESLAPKPGLQPPGSSPPPGAPPRSPALHEHVALEPAAS